MSRKRREPFWTSDLFDRMSDQIMSHMNTVSNEALFPGDGFGVRRPVHVEETHRVFDNSPKFFYEETHKVMTLDGWESCTTQGIRLSMGDSSGRRNGGFSTSLGRGRNGYDDGQELDQIYYHQPLDQSKLTNRTGGVAQARIPYYNGNKSGPAPRSIPRLDEGYSEYPYYGDNGCQPELIEELDHNSGRESFKSPVFRRIEEYDPDSHVPGSKRASESKKPRKPVPNRHYDTRAYGSDEKNNSHIQDGRTQYEDYLEYKIRQVAFDQAAKDPSIDFEALVDERLREYGLAHSCRHGPAEKAEELSIASSSAYSTSESYSARTASARSSPIRSSTVRPATPPPKVEYHPAFERSIPRR